MMALMLGAFEICVHVLRTRGLSRTGWHARLFFMLVAHGPQGTAGRMAAQCPPSREAGSEAAGHARAPEPSALGR
jgi:hypothetical protein